MVQIQRKQYLDFLIRYKEEQIIKVVTGVRRCGKSTLFELYRDYLLTNGVNSSQIIMINFEDVEYEDLLDYRALYNYIKEQLLPDKMNYIFLDEIQHVAEYEKAVDSLFIKKNCDVYITGLVLDKKLLKEFRYNSRVYEANKFNVANWRTCRSSRKGSC